MPHPLDELRTIGVPFILYIGEGLPQRAGLPSRRDLVHALLDEAMDSTSPSQHRELVELARGPEFGGVLSELERVLTPARFGRIVEHLFERDVEVPALGHLLARLFPHLRGVITPNLDPLIEWAFKGRLKPLARPVPGLGSRKGWLLKLHGTLLERDTWVLTEEQQDRANHVCPEFFSSLFMGPPILFVATRLDKPILGRLLRRLKALAHGQPPRHWALVPAAETGAIQRRALAGAGVEVVAFDDEAALHQMLASLADSLTVSHNAGVLPDAAMAQDITPSAPDPAVAPNCSPTAASPPTASEPATSARSGRLWALLVTANPERTARLRLGRELRIIGEAIQRSHYRDSLRLEILTAATATDLRRALLDHPYDVVHISGHGEQDSLILEDDRGIATTVSASSLAKLVSRYAQPSGPLRCLLLNACWSRTIGEDASMRVPFVIAMDGPVDDRGILEFSRGFYDALGAGRDVPEAYAEGCNNVELNAPGVRFESILLRN